MKIHILGAAGTGTTSIGKHIAQYFNLPHIETDFFSWKQTNPPFSTYIEKAESAKAIRSWFDAQPSFVISGSLSKYGKDFAKDLDLVVFLTAPLDVRLKRIQAREKKLYGKRVLPGGDMHENYLSFVDFAKRYDNGDLSFRSKAQHQKFLTQDISCPIIEINTDCEQSKVLNGLIASISKVLYGNFEPNNNNKV